MAINSIKNALWPTNPTGAALANNVTTNTVGVGVVHTGGAGPAVGPAVGTINPMHNTIYNGHSWVPIPDPYINSSTYQSQLQQDLASMQAKIETITSSVWRHRAVAMRMRYKDGEGLPFAYFSTHYTGEKVFAFIVVKDQPVTLEDEGALFPSDTFMTQLRMLMD